MTKIRVELLAPGELVAGRPLQGRIVMTVAKKQTVASVKVSLVGRAYAAASMETENYVYKEWNSATLVDEAAVLFDPPGKRALLGPGEHAFDFSIPCDEWLPPVFAHCGAYVQYLLQASIDTAALLRGPRTVRLAVPCRGTFDWDLFDGATLAPLRQPVTAAGSKKFFMARGECELHVEVPGAVFLDAFFPVRVLVINRSTKVVRSISLKLVQTTIVQLNKLGGQKVQNRGRIIVPNTRIEALETRELNLRFSIPAHVLPQFDIGFVRVTHALHVATQVSSAANLRVKAQIEISAPWPPDLTPPKSRTLVTETGQGENAKERDFQRDGDDAELDESAAADASDLKPLAPQPSRLRGDTVLAQARVAPFPEPTEDDTSE
jgi:hypothetical protein